MEEDKIIIEYYNNDFIINIDLEDNGIYKAIFDKKYYTNIMILCNTLKEILNDDTSIKGTSYSIKGIYVLRNFVSIFTYIISMSISRRGVQIFLKGINGPLKNILVNEFINKVSDVSTVYSEELGRYLTIDDIFNIIEETEFYNILNKFKNDLIETN